MKLIYITATAIAVAGGAYYFTQSRPLSAAERQHYGKQCEEWIAKEFGNDRPSHVSDAWRKRGSLVFQVLTEEEDKSGYSVLLCVVDPALGQMLKPSAFVTAEWR